MTATLFTITAASPVAQTWRVVHHTGAELAVSVVRHDAASAWEWLHTEQVSGPALTGRPLRAVENETEKRATLAAPREG